MDSVIRDLSNAIQESPVASSPGMSTLLSRAITRSGVLEKNADNTSAAFFRQLGKDLMRLRGHANAAPRLECLFRACAFLWQFGDTRNALDISHHAIDLAKATDNRAELRRWYIAIGVLHGDLGDSGLSLQSYLQSLEYAIELGDGIGECTAWNNLSALFVNSGLYTEALACAGKSLQIADRFGLIDTDLPARAKNNIVLAKHRLGDHSGALAVARRLAAAANEPQTPYEASGRVNLEQHLIFVLIAQGELAEARPHVEYVRSLVMRFPSPRQKLIVATVSGLWEVISGNSAHGIQLLEEAVAVARTQLLSVYPDALAALSKAYEEIGDCERALDVTCRLIGHLESVHIDASLSSVLAIDGVQRFASQGLTSNRAELKRAQAELRTKVLQRELDRSRQEMLERMAVAVDIREDISGEHGYRVGRLSALLAKEISWDRESCSAIDFAARLHDIGKIGIPERILLDERTLKEAEKRFIASHTLVGAEILSKSEIPQVRIAEEIARCHHEWWDGSGYPRGLKGLAIPRSARIVALADVFDAMTHGRPYAKAIPIEAALDEIASLRGRQFDPELTDHFLALVRRLAAENPDLDAFLGKAARNSPFLKARARIKEMLAQGRDSAALSEYPPAPGSPLN